MILEQVQASQALYSGYRLVALDCWALILRETSLDRH